jgi:hypothetical protein
MTNLYLELLALKDCIVLQPWIPTRMEEAMMMLKAY